MNSNNDFKVLPEEVPDKLTVHLTMSDRCMLAELLTAMMIPATDAKSNICHILRNGILKKYLQA